MCVYFIYYQLKFSTLVLVASSIDRGMTIQKVTRPTKINLFTQQQQLYVFSTPMRRQQSLRYQLRQGILEKHRMVHLRQRQWDLRKQQWWALM